MYITRDKEAGNIIDEFATLEEAREALKGYVEEDKKDNTYTPDFYEIFDSQTEQIIETM